MNDHQANRIEAMLRALLENLKPSMSFSEVKQATGYASKGAARKWLRDHGVQRSGKGWRRVQVIAALAEGRR